MKLAESIAMIQWRGGILLGLLGFGVAQNAEIITSQFGNAEREIIFDNNTVSVFEYNRPYGVVGVWLGVHAKIVNSIWRKLENRIGPNYSV